MKIAFIGSRGIPARYSGFETFYEQIAVRLADRGHDVTVYNRRHFMGEVENPYQGVRIVTLPGLKGKHLDTLSHTAVAALHALFQGYDIAYFCIVGNSPLVWIPRLTGAKVLLNVDGEDWARDKWGTFARWYQRQCEWIATKTSNLIISDAKGIRDRYQKLYDMETVFVPYGANIHRAEGMEALDKWGLEQDGYYLCVGRFVPENAFHVAMEAFRKVKTERKLVIVGDSPYENDYQEELKAMAARDPRVILTGYAFNGDYAQLSSHAFAFLLPSAVDGTRPVLLDQMGFGNCVIVRDSTVNREVVADWGLRFDRENPLEGLIEVMTGLEQRPTLIDKYRGRVRQRIEQYYNWEWVVSFYEELFEAVIKSDDLSSYDHYVNSHCGTSDECAPSR
jgi:glycosyltransferase involved in cell wall biosynthesis